MKSLKNSCGFSLLELIIAVSISSLVLIGIISVATSMVQFEVESARKGSVTAWTMASITTMNRDIASASVIQWPSGDGATADTVRLCTNWSRLAGAGPAPGNGAILSVTPPNPTVISYCWEGATHLLRRLVATAACPNVGVAPPACDAANYGAGDIVATAVYQAPGNPNLIFTSEVHGAAVDGYAVRLRYVVGNPNQGTVDVPSGPGTVFVNPQSLTFDTKIPLEN